MAALVGRRHRPRDLHVSAQRAALCCPSGRSPCSFQVASPPPSSGVINVLAGKGEGGSRKAWRGKKQSGGGKAEVSGDWQVTDQSCRPHASDGWRQPENTNTSRWCHGEQPGTVAGTSRVAACSRQQVTAVGGRRRSLPLRGAALCGVARRPASRILAAPRQRLLRQNCRDGQRRF